MKPEGGSGGRGLTLLGSADIQKLLHQKNKHQRLQQPSIYVQKYLHNTFLLDYRLPSKNKIIKVKFDFRVYLCFFCIILFLVLSCIFKLLCKRQISS